jgi:hypothetical protein
MFAYNPLLGLILAAGSADARENVCWIPSRMRYDGRDTLTFTSQELAQQQENEAAQLEKRQPKEIRAGWLAVRVERMSLVGADPAHQLVVVEREGQELFRFEPPTDVPNLAPDIYGFFWAYAVAPLPEGLAPPFEVTVVDRLHQVRCRWDVDSEGEIVRLKER